MSLAGTHPEKRELHQRSSKQRRPIASKHLAPKACAGSSTWKSTATSCFYLFWPQIALVPLPEAMIYPAITQGSLSLRLALSDTLANCDGFLGQNSSSGRISFAQFRSLPR